MLCVLLSSALAGGLWLSGALDRFEQVTWSWRARLLGRPSAFTPRIKLVLLDQAGLDWGHEVMGLSWPWPREIYVPLLQFMQRSGARGVAFDVLYTEPSAYQVADDTALGAAMADTTNMVAALFLGNTTGRREQWPAYAVQPDWQVDGLAAWQEIDEDTGVRKSGLFPIPEVAASVDWLGNVQDEPDADSVFRRAGILRIFDGIPVPSLGLALYLSTHPEACRASVCPGTLTLGNQAFPMDTDGRVLLNYRASAETYEAVSAAAVIQSELRMQSGEPAVVNPETFRDCYVLFGFSAPGLMDVRATPVSSVTPGVFVHATLLDNLLTGDLMREVPRMQVVLLQLLLAGACAGATLRLKRAVYSLPAAVLALGLAAGTSFLFYAMGLAVPLVGLCVTALLAVGGAVLVNYATEGRQKLFIKKAFQHYLSHDVIEQLLEHPDQLQLGGERKELTILFSDVQGFSSISEQLDPQTLTSLLNDYLSEMTDIIFDEGGTLDKYEGDAIMAFWNAPLSQADHAAHACRAALRCQQRLQEMRTELVQRYGHPLYARIGIHTGDVVVGNMGSHNRFDYTVLGDAANLASRLEGANKVFGSYIMISEITRRQAGPDLVARELGQIRVVGRASLVRVYELLPKEDDATRKQRLRFEKGLQFVFSNDWKNALEIFQSLENDPVAAVYAARCEKVLQEEMTWDGSWNLTEK